MVVKITRAATRAELGSQKGQERPHDLRTGPRTDSTEAHRGRVVREAGAQAREEEQLVVKRLNLRPPPVVQRPYTNVGPAVVHAAARARSGQVDESEGEPLLRAVDTLDAELGCNFW